MKTVKIIVKKPSVRIDTSWFPYKDIVDEKQFEKICSMIEMAVKEHCLKNGTVYYDVVKTDKQNNPLEIVIGYTTKRFLNENENVSVLLTKFNHQRHSNY